jgi:polysaccharide pyruvyl transferase WcaK-like protein
LTANSIEANGVVGDPALLYERSGSVPSVARWIGLCLGNDGGNSTSPATLAKALLQLDPARHNLYKVFVLSPGDLPTAEALREELGSSAQLVRYAGDVDYIMDEIASCQLMVSERLHGSIAAAAVDVRPVSLAYLSKCVDFMESVGLGDYVFDPGDSAEALGALLLRAMTDSTNDWLLRRDELRSSLRREARAIAGV